MVADATAWAGAERKIERRIGRRAALWREASRVKSPWLGPEALAPVKVKDGHHHVHAHRNPAPAQLIFLGAATANRPNRRIDAQRLLDHLSRVRERAEVVVCESALRPMRVHLRQQLLLYLRML